MRQIFLGSKTFSDYWLPINLINTNLWNHIYHDKKFKYLKTPALLSGWNIEKIALGKNMYTPLNKTSLVFGVFITVKVDNIAKIDKSWTIVSHF